MKRFFLGICVMLMTMTATAQTDKFCIAKDGKAATIVVDNNDWKGVLMAAAPCWSMRLTSPTQRKPTLNLQSPLA